MRYQITAPVQGVNSTIAAVTFRDSVAEVDSETQGGSLAYFRRHGYRVDELEADGDLGEQLPTPPTGSPEDEPKQPARSAPRAEWVAYAIAKGALPEDAEAKTVAQLVELYAKTGETA